MGYSTIIDSLVDNRTINEGSLLRDNKQILRKIEKQLHFFKEVFLCSNSRSLCYIDWFVYNHRVTSSYFLLRLHIEDTMYKCVEDGDSLYYCIDLKSLLSYNNIKYFTLAAQSDDSLDTLIESDVEYVCDMIFDNGSGVSITDTVSLISDLGFPCTYTKWDDLRADKVLRYKVTDELAKRLKSKLPDYIDKCFDVGNVQNRAVGNKNLFYKNGCLAVARVDIKEDRVVFPYYGVLEVCSLNSNAGDKEHVKYHTISDVVDKGYTSNSESNLTINITPKYNIRVNLTDDKKSWVETRN